MLAQSAAWSNLERKALCLLLYADVTFAKYVHMAKPYLLSTTVISKTFKIRKYRTILFVHVLLLPLPRCFAHTNFASFFYINTFLIFTSFPLNNFQGLEQLSRTHAALPVKGSNFRYARCNCPCHQRVDLTLSTVEMFKTCFFPHNDTPCNQSAACHLFSHHSRLTTRIITLLFLVTLEGVVRIFT